MSDYTGLFLIVGGVPRLVTAPDLAHWLALGRGATLGLDVVTAEHIVVGIAKENVWPAPRRRMPVLGDGR